MKHLIWIIAVFVCISAPVLAAERSLHIAAVVNDEAISQNDVQARLKLIIVTSGLQDSPDIRDRLLPQVINDLVEEQIMLQEASKNDIEISSEEIAQAFAALAQQNNMDADSLAAIMDAQNIPRTTLHNKLRAEIAWSRVVQAVLRPRVDVTENDVEDRINRLRSQIGKTEYLLAEIFLPVDDTKREKDVKSLAARLADEIRSGKTPFQKIAAQFSGAAGALQQGGMLGWVQEGQLAEEIDRVLPTMQEGEISQPLRTLDGYHIVLLRGLRTISEENLPSKEQMTNQIGLERLERLQRRHLLNIKSAAFIEQRV